MRTSELLLEIFCEEIPARMQTRAAADLARLLGDGLKELGFVFGAVRSFAGPRRLTAVIDDLPNKAPDVREERKGPRVGAPEQALAGFLRGAGLQSIDQCEVQEAKKGSFYVAIIERPGLAADEAVAQIVPKLMREFPWPKSMKWGRSDFRWVRPLHGILCQLDGQRVDFEVAGIRTSDKIYGHRIMGPGPFTVSGFADYQKTLAEKGKVVLDAADRKAMISDQIAALCTANNLELAEDAALLDEVTGLAEWPVALLGTMDADFLSLPAEVIQLSMAKHQKYFTVRDPKTGKVAPHFIVIANLDAPDGGKAIAQGNARVLSARLADARYFWDTDLKTPLEDRTEKLSDVVFHQKLGSVYDKMERVAALARELAPVVGANPDLAERAAKLAKADLTSEMVVEFTSLQGVMGRYYALAEGKQNDTTSPHPEGLPPSRPGSAGTPQDKGAIVSKERGLSDLPEADLIQIADAIRDHYKPQGPSDSVPTDPVSVAVALADKLDTLVGFWAIDEKPTGSKDPYALRRAALGVIRLVLGNGVRFDLHELILNVHKLLTESLAKKGVLGWINENDVDDEDGNRVDLILLISSNTVVDEGYWDLDSLVSEMHMDGALLVAPNTCEQIKCEGDEERFSKGEFIGAKVVVKSLLPFFHERLKVYLREQGARHDLIDAVLAPGIDGKVENDFLAVRNKVKALGAFINTSDGEQLSVGTKRAFNIIKIEEKRDNKATVGEPDPSLFTQDEEIALFAALSKAQEKAAAALKSEDYTAAMVALAPLRPVIDAFFDEVTVNADDPALRANRLALLAMFRQSLRQVADFDKIAG
ncbi:MAG: glycine--tRNA ligase subunit beta [Robiginitomaculum sp.]|nr:glycine--tRNA ligase subunit beta [Robiginitomaculum sp.]MDQ7077130.1 glycine--tRNA ligase subunit beta [Robiginitomaculum sp.]